MLHIKTLEGDGTVLPGPEHSIGESARVAAQERLDAGDIVAALDILLEAGRADPTLPDIHYQSGVVALMARCMTVAESAFCRELERQPNHADSLFNLGWTLRRLGRPDEAEIPLRHLLDLRPDWGDCWYNLGNILMDRGRWDEAAACFRNAVSKGGPAPDCSANLAMALWRTGESNAAETILRGVRSAYPDHIEAANTLANLLTGKGRGKEALTIFDDILGRRPDEHTALFNRGLALLAVGRTRKAARDLARAVALVPDSARYWNGVGSVALAEDRVAEAKAAFEHALDLDPILAEAWNNLGNLHSYCGRKDGARECYARAMQAAPDDMAIHSNALMSLIHHEGITEEVVMEHRRFGLIHQARVEPLPLSLDGRFAPDRRIRVGYVSPDLCEHALSFWFEPVLRLHDRSEFEITCYHVGLRSDHVTARMTAQADHWRSLGHCDPNMAAQIIIEDGIDILVDLAGHTACNGLPIFLRKPAPIQATWLGYPTTTGLSRIDYRITDAECDPPGRADQIHSETLVRLNRIAMFDPPANAPDPGPLPMAEGRPPRFGSFNRPQKITPAVVALWCRLLETIPAATLLMVVPGGDEESVGSATRAPFAAAGIAAERIEVTGRRDLGGFFQLLAGVDVALDPFPYGGGTTSPLSLWMGVPVVSLPDGQTSSGISAAFCRAVGLSTLVARDQDHYLRIAARLVRTPRRLSVLRAQLRRRMQSCAFLDARAVVRALEDAYRDWMRRLRQSIGRH